jgi:DNA repair protein RecO (recombination protein O)
VALVKTDAIVLRTIDYSETSLIVWLFTREHGRVHVIAKGARRPRSIFEGALEPLVRGELVFYRKAKPDGLETAKEFDPIDLNRGLRSDLARLHRGLYVAELLTELSEHDLPSPSAFAAAAEALRALSTDALPHLDRHVLRLELALLGAGGLSPVLDRCVRCGGPPFEGDEERAFFAPGAGGVLCRKHGDGDASTLEVRRPVLRALLALALGREGTPDPAQTLELRRLLDGYLAWHIGRPLRLARRLNPLPRPAAPQPRAKGTSRAQPRPQPPRARARSS